MRKDPSHTRKKVDRQTAAAINLERNKADAPDTPPTKSERVFDEQAQQAEIARHKSHYAPLDDDSDADEHELEMRSAPRGEGVRFNKSVLVVKEMPDHPLPPSLEDPEDAEFSKSHNHGLVPLPDVASAAVPDKLDGNNEAYDVDDLEGHVEAAMDRGTQRRIVHHRKKYPDGWAKELAQEALEVGAPKDTSRTR